MTNVDALAHDFSYGLSLVFSVTEKRIFRSN